MKKLFFFAKLEIVTTEITKVVRFPTKKKNPTVEILFRPV